MTYVSAEAAPEPGQSGVACARELVDSGQITIHPEFGAGKGPRYTGPYAAYARPEGFDPGATDLYPDILASQLDPVERKRGRKVGGRARIAEGQETSYQNAIKVARERNYIPYLVKRRREKRSRGEERKFTSLNDGRPIDEPVRNVAQRRR